jgi:hypothetical protein
MDAERRYSPGLVPVTVMPTVRQSVAPRLADASDSDTFLLLCDVLAAQERSPRLATILSDNEALLELIAFAERERVLPALNQAVALAYADCVPKACRVVLATQYEQNRRRNASIRRALLDLGNEGGAVGLEFAALKGVAWVIEDDAGSAAWRSMIDIDVLVDPRRFDEVPPLLGSMGYTRASQSKRFRRNFHHAPYLHPEIAVTLEVHRHLGWRHRLLPSETVFASAQRVAAGLWLPAPWCRAFHAMIHWQIQDFGLSRRTTPLKDVQEVSHFLQRSDVDWAALSMHARAVGASEACKAASALAAALLGTPVPGELMVADRGTRRHVALCLARRASPVRAWLATQAWRAGTLWRCEKIAYRLGIRGAAAPTIRAAVWAGRFVRLPLLVVRAVGIAVRLVVLCLRQRAVNAR